MQSVSSGIPNHEAGIASLTEGWLRFIARDAMTDYSDLKLFTGFTSPALMD